jgi:hypothetical protein
MSNNLTPTIVRQREDSLEELCRRADPEWQRDRHYLPAYEFKTRTFVDHRDNVYRDTD